MPLLTGTWNRTKLLKSVTALYFRVYFKNENDSLIILYNITFQVPQLPQCIIGLLSIYSQI